MEKRISGSKSNQDFQKGCPEATRWDSKLNNGSSVKEAFETPRGSSAVPPTGEGHEPV